MPEIVEVQDLLEGTATLPGLGPVPDFPGADSPPIVLRMPRGTGTMEDVWKWYGSRGGKEEYAESTEGSSSGWVNSLVSFDEMGGAASPGPYLDHVFQWVKSRTMNRHTYAGLFQQIWRHAAQTSGFDVSPLKTCGLPATVVAKSFCESNNLGCAVGLAADLVKSCFRTAEGLNLQTEEDPETGEQWVVLDFTVRGAVQEILAGHNAFVERWCLVEPTDKEGLIRIEFNIL